VSRTPPENDIFMTKWKTASMKWGDYLFFFHGIGGSDTPSHHHIVVGRAVFPATSGVVENQLPTLGFKLVYFFHQGPEVAVAERGDTISFQAVPWLFLPDGNGNLTGAGDVSALYNIMNQPTTLTHAAGRTRHFAYIYGGGKYKVRLLINPDFEETRHYLGGLEFVDGEPEALQLRRWSHCLDTCGEQHYAGYGKSTAAAVSLARPPG
jgi:hypothetical protein